MPSIRKKQDFLGPLFMGSRAGAELLGIMLV